MKKFLGIFFAFAVFCISAVISFSYGNLNADNSAIVVNAAVDNSTDTYFPGRNSEFKIFNETNGIFILKDGSQITDPTDTFAGGVGITKNSGTDTETGKTYFDLYSDFRYEAVYADAKGVWQKTDMLQISVNPNKKSVEYRLPKMLSAGKYGVKVTAYHSGSAANNYQDALVAYDYNDNELSEVSSVYVIMYGEDLNYIYCMDSDGNSVYNARSNGLGKTIAVNVVVNAGAISQDNLDIEMIGVSQIGNLTLNADISVSNLKWQIENASGIVLESDVIPVSVQSGAFNLTLPKGLSTGNYVLRVYHSSNPDIYGTFIIDNSAKTSGGGALDGVGGVLLVFGLLIVVAGAVLIIVPKVQVRVGEARFKRAENQRYMQNIQDDKQSKAQSAKSAYKNASEISEIRSLGGYEDAPKEIKERINKMRAENYKETKSEGFLQKLYENRMKRDVAREAGLSLEEFKEVEKKARTIQDAKQSSLGEFRKAVEEKTGIITQQQQQTQEKKEEIKPKREAGEPEFELLDSVKQETPLREQEFVEKAVAPNVEHVEKVESSILQRLKRMTGEAEPESVDKFNETASMRDIDSSKEKIQPHEIYSDKIETQQQEVNERPVVSNVGQNEEAAFTHPESTTRPVLDNEPAERIAPDVKIGEEIPPISKPAETSEVESPETEKSSILQRLKRLSGEE